jgi:ribonuclease HII
LTGTGFILTKDYGHKTIIKGDGLYFSIAAASVLAKTFRDEYMGKICIMIIRIMAGIPTKATHTLPQGSHNEIRYYTISQENFHLMRSPAGF